MTMQNNIEFLKDQMNVHGMTVDQANVELVRMKRVRLVTGSLPASVRKALNAAVKTGELGHFKKDGHKPEAYFHPTFDFLAKDERNKHLAHVISSLRATCV